MVKSGADPAIYKQEKGGVPTICPFSNALVVLRKKGVEGCGSNPGILPPGSETG